MSIEDQNEPQVGRGIPLVAKKSSNTGWAGVLVIGLIGAAAIGGVLAVNGAFSSDNEIEYREERSEVRNVLGNAPVVKLTAVEPEQPVYAQPQEPKEIRTGRPPEPTYIDDDDTISPRERKLSSPLLGYGEPSKTRQAQPRTVKTEKSHEDYMIELAKVSMQGGQDTPAEVADELHENLKPTELSGVRASIIRDKSFFLTRGNFLDCVLETAISSDVAGMTSCRISKDTYSTDGKTLLLERGSRVTGQYKSGVTRGKARIFVLWDRVETPNGVIVELASPGTDALGRSGHSGYLDTHFFERFGSCTLIVLVCSTLWHAAPQWHRSRSLKRP